MNVRRLVTAAVVVVALAAPASALAGSISVTGKGRATYQALGDATAFSTYVLTGGRVLATGDVTVTISCARPRAKRCYRINHRTGAYIVLKPVTVLAEGTDFRLAIVSGRGFNLGITGVGRVVLSGSGSYTTSGQTSAYVGRRVVTLAG